MATEVLPPPYVITDDDKRGLLVVITATTLSFVWTCLLIRIWLRYKTREWRSDDYFLAAATILDTAQSGVVFHLVDDGLGRSRKNLGEVDLRRIGQLAFTAQILYIITLLLSKCAVLLLYMRLSPEKGHVVASKVTLGVSTMWAIIAIILITLPCNPLEFWTHGAAKCLNIWPRWQAIGAIDMITEMLIFLISIYLVAKLNMRMKSKAMVVAAFSSRLPVIAAAAIRLYYLHTTLISPDRTLAGTYYIVSTRWHVGYAIMSTTITGLGPFLRPFSKSFSTSYRRSSYAHNAQDSSVGLSQDRSDFLKGATYQMQNLKARQVSVRDLGTRRSIPCLPQAQSYIASTAPAPLLSAVSLTLRPDTDMVKRDTAVRGGSAEASIGSEEDGASRASDESQRMIITKRTELTVETDRVSRVSRSD